MLLATLGLATASARTSQGDLNPTLLAFVPDQTIWTIALTDRYLAWESDAGDGSPTALSQRDLRTRRQRILASSVFSEYGLASTRGWIVYVSPARSLFAVRHDGSGRHRLAANLVAPVAERRERVAWAELDHGTYRVVVRNMATGKQWLAAEVSRCMSNRCFRIDGVTLADRGVVFTRGAIGAQPSYIVRRAYGDPAPTSVAVPRDPQPDLAPSSAGALYYAFGRGWYRWDFGTRNPTATHFGASDENTVLRYEHGYWFTPKAATCKDALQVIHPNGATTTLAASGSILKRAHLRPSSCAEIIAFAAVGKKALSVWRVQQKASDPYPVGLTLVGLVFSQRYRD